MDKQQEIKNLMSEEMVNNHFEAFLQRVYSGNQIEALKKSGQTNTMYMIFEYGFVKGSEESLAVIKEILKREKENEQS